MPDAKSLGIINGQRDLSGNLTGGVHEATGQKVTVTNGQMQPDGPVNAAWKAAQATPQTTATKAVPGVLNPTFDGTGRVVGGIDQHTGETLTVNDAGQLRGDGKPNVPLVQKLQQQAAQPAAPAPAIPTHSAGDETWKEQFGAYPGTAANPDTRLGPPPIPTNGKTSQTAIPAADQPVQTVRPGESASFNGRPIAPGTKVTPIDPKYGGGFAYASNDGAAPADGGTGIVRNGVQQTKDANGNFVADMAHPQVATTRVAPSAGAPTIPVSMRPDILSPGVSGALAAASGVSPLSPDGPNTSTPAAPMTSLQKVAAGTTSIIPASPFPSIPTSTPVAPQPLPASTSTLASVASPTLDKPSAPLASSSFSNLSRTASYAAPPTIPLPTTITADNIARPQAPGITDPGAPADPVTVQNEAIANDPAKQQQITDPRPAPVAAAPQMAGGYNLTAMGVPKIPMPQATTTPGVDTPSVPAPPTVEDEEKKRIAGVTP